LSCKKIFEAEQGFDQKLQSEAAVKAFLEEDWQSIVFALPAVLCGSAQFLCVLCVKTRVPPFRSDAVPR
jgi:hypothetical protein